jgi:hypothetical protein
LAITSIQHQCIYIYWITSGGKLRKEFELGYHTRQDDFIITNLDGKDLQQDLQEDEIPEQVQSTSTTAQFQYIPDNHLVPGESTGFHFLLSPPEFDFKTKKSPLGGLKQRIMSFLFRKTKGDPAALSHFYMMFTYFTTLVMWKSHFIDQDHLLIKYGPPQDVLGRPELNANCYFIIYQISTTKIIDIYDNSSPTLFEMFKNWDLFRGSCFQNDPFLGTLICNNKYARSRVEKQMNAISKAKTGGVLQSLKRVLSNLPISAQSFSESPFFDLNLFSFDEKYIGANERYFFSSL